MRSVNESTARNRNPQVGSGRERLARLMHSAATPVVEIDVEAPAVAVRGAYDTAGPRQAAAAPGSGTG